MLVLPLKPAVRFDLQTALAFWLDDSEQQVSFEPTNPLQFILPKPDFSSADCREDLVRLQSLRVAMTDTLLKQTSHKSALEEGALRDCHEYHAALLEFEKRGFPTLDDPDTGIQLTWKGAFAPQQERHATLLWDRACVMFNIVALETSLTAKCSATDRAECKQAVAHCQTAAGILAVLKELVASQDFATVDLSQSMLTFWEKLLLAQAQTSIYRMAALANDKTKHGTLSVLAQSSYDLFNQALQAAQDPRLQSEVPRQAADWGAFCKANSMLSGAKAEYHQAVLHRIASEWGKELSRLRDCQAKLEACMTFLKTCDEDGVVSYALRETKAILPVVQDRLKQADQDNYKVYQDKIPASLPEIVPKQLAKANPSLPPSMLLPSKPLFTNV